MSGESKIEWTDSTFNPWSLPETFASLQLSRVADAVRLEMPQFMAWVAQRHAIGHFVSKLRACAEAKPVAWLRPENRVEEECTARTRISIGERCPPIGTWRPLYTHPAPVAP